MQISRGHNVVLSGPERLGGVKRRSRDHCHCRTWLSFVSAVHDEAAIGERALDNDANWARCGRDEARLLALADGHLLWQDAILPRERPS